jgi:hypothetical protein
LNDKLFYLGFSEYTLRYEMLFINPNQDFV